MQGMKRLVLGALALMGFRGRASAQANPTPLVNTAQQQNWKRHEAPEVRRAQCPPHIWGQSQACRRMVRKNRLHAMGISLARI